MVDRISIVTNATAFTYGTEQYVSLNNLYRSGGHKPYGFDTYASLYRQYKVLSCKVTFDLYTDNSNVTFSARYYPPGSTATFSGSLVEAVAERPGTRSIHGVGWSNSPLIKTRLVFDTPIHDVIGVTKQMYDADVDLYSAAIAANPTREAKIQFATASAATTGTQSTWVLISYDFEVLFWQRSTVAQS
jgi:hypothetical protein